MKTLIVYYSLTGNVKFIADSIAKVTNADLLQLKPRKDHNPKGMMKFVWGGKEVLTKKTPELLPFNCHPENYDLIFIGTPVWSWTYAPALRSFFSKIKLSNKKIALFCCHQGGKGKTLRKMKETLGEDNEYLGEIDFLEPLKKETEEKSKKAENWARSLF